MERKKGREEEEREREREREGRERRGRGRKTEREKKGEEKGTESRWQEEGGAVESRCGLSLKVMNNHNTISIRFN